MTRCRRSRARRRGRRAGRRGRRGGRYGGSADMDEAWRAPESLHSPSARSAPATGLPPQHAHAPAPGPVDDVPVGSGRPRHLADQPGVAEQAAVRRPHDAVPGAGQRQGRGAERRSGWRPAQPGCLAGRLRPAARRRCGVDRRREDPRLGDRAVRGGVRGSRTRGRRPRTPLPTSIGVAVLPDVASRGLRAERRRRPGGRRRRRRTAPRVTTTARGVVPRQRASSRTAPSPARRRPASSEPPSASTPPPTTHRGHARPRPAGTRTRWAHAAARAGTRCEGCDG